MFGLVLLLLGIVGVFLSYRSGANRRSRLEEHNDWVRENMKPVPRLRDLPPL
jgi:hypothetical protein